MGMVNLHSGNIAREDSEKILGHVREAFGEYGDDAWEDFVRDHVVVSESSLSVGVSDDEDAEGMLLEAVEGLSDFLADNRMDCAISCLSSCDDEPSACVCTRRGTVDFDIGKALEEARAGMQARLSTGAEPGMGV